MADLIVRVAANLTELKKNLEEGNSLVETTRTHMARMTKSFDGTSIISQAGAVVGAIDKIGGVAKLTATEQAKANAILEAGIEKYKALGREAPAGMQALYEATRKVEPPLNSTYALLGKIWGGLKSAAGLVGIAFTAGAVVNFGSRVFAAAGEVDDMAQKLSVSAEAAQRYRFVAEQTGTSVDKFGAAILKMNRSLAQGDDGTIAALRRAGLELDDLRAKRPEDAFNAIVDAVQQIPDPMIQTEVAMRLFGKAGAELLPAIREGISQIAAGATVMSDETVKRLAAAEDAWAKLWNAVVVHSGEAVAKGLSLYEHLTSSVGNFGSYLKNTLMYGTLIAQEIALAEQRTKDLAATQEKAADAARKAAVDHEALAETLAEEARRKQEAEAKAKALAAAQVELQSAGEGWRGTLEGINAAVVAQVKAYLDAGVSQSALQTVYNLTATQVRAVASALAEERKAFEESERAAEKHAQAVLKATETVADLWRDHNQAMLDSSLSMHTTLLARIEEWKQKQITAAQEAGMLTAEVQAQIAAAASERYQRELVDIDGIRQHSRTYLQEQAAQAEATYQYMLERSSEFTQAFIEQKRLEAEAARAAADSWGTAFTQTMAEVKQKAIDTSASLVSSAQRAALTWSEAMTLVAQGKGTMTMTVVGAPILNQPWGRRADGGPVEAGKPYVVGEDRPELFIPERNGMILPTVPPAFGTGAVGAVQSGPAVYITNHISVGGTIIAERRLTDTIKDALMNDLRRLGLRNGVVA